MFNHIKCSYKCKIHNIPFILAPVHLYKIQKDRQLFCNVNESKKKTKHLRLSVVKMSTF